MSIQSVAVSAVLLAVLPTLACALEEIENVTRQRATELGMIVRAEAAGPDAVHVELEFPTTGELKDFRRVEIRIEDGKKLIFSSTLKEETSASGHLEFPRLRYGLRWTRRFWPRTRMPPRHPISEFSPDRRSLSGPGRGRRARGRPPR